MPEMVFDLGPLQRLHRGGALEVLHPLYNHVIVPREVADEIARGRAEGLELPDLDALNWIEVRDVREGDLISVVTGLGPTERASLALATEIAGAIYVTDEVIARRQAKMLRRAYTGTIGILIKAKKARVIPRLAPVLDLLDSRGFRFLPQTRQVILAWVGER